MSSPYDLARSTASGPAKANIDRIQSFFEALERFDFSAVGEMFSADGLYRDVPVAPDADAVGPEAITAKLDSAITGLDAFVLGVQRVVAQGDLVMSERVEEWHFPTGEVAKLPVMAAHEMRGDEIASWREYWNLPTLMEQLPQSWLEVQAQRRTGETEAS